MAIACLCVIRFADSHSASRVDVCGADATLWVIRFADSHSASRVEVCGADATLWVIRFADSHNASRIDVCGADATLWVIRFADSHSASRVDVCGAGATLWVRCRKWVHSGAYGTRVHRADPPCDQQWRLWIDPGVDFGSCNHFIKSPQALVQPNQPLHGTSAQRGAHGMSGLLCCKWSGVGCMQVMQCRTPFDTLRSVRVFKAGRHAHGRRCVRVHIQRKVRR
jgi:hypothetical protein